ncbi:AAC(3) family N-acetyltransferase [bacterium]|nr:AAC(3) family N-acetyltransferase [bacterium]
MLSQQQLEQDLRSLGLQGGMHVLVHSSLNSLGWVCGGAQAVVSALVSIITPAGTILMPAFSNWNSEPAGWRNPPVPEAWHAAIRESMPPYIPQISPSRGLGRVPELFRSLPGVQRSAHPVCSFCAWGRLSGELVSGHARDCQLGERSPLGALYRADGHVLSLGVRTNSMLHLSEHLADWPGRSTERQGCAMLVDGARRWVEFEDLATDDSDFMLIKDDFERETQDTRSGMTGQAQSRLVRARAIVDYGRSWMERERGNAGSVKSEQ